jgi:hypothetical protein
LEGKNPYAKSICEILKKITSYAKFLREVLKDEDCRVGDESFKVLKRIAKFSYISRSLQMPYGKFTEPEALTQFRHVTPEKMTEMLSNSA